MNALPRSYGEWCSGKGLCTLSNCCCVVNIFILTIRAGSELRGTSHSRSAELHDWAHAAARGISTFQSNFVTARLCCPPWPSALRAAPQCEGLWLLTFAHTNVRLWCACLHFRPHPQTLWPATQFGREWVWVIRFAFLLCCCCCCCRTINDVLLFVQSDLVTAAKHMDERQQLEGAFKIYTFRIIVA